MHHLRIVVLGLALVFCGWSLYAADAEAGASKYMVCIGCHGMSGEGNVAMNAPKLAGQEIWYLESQLKAFKSGIRGAADGPVLT